MFRFFRWRQLVGRRTLHRQPERWELRDVRTGPAAVHDGGDEEGAEADVLRHGGRPV